jgi:hypothetical protein
MQRETRVMMETRRKVIRITKQYMKLLHKQLTTKRSNWKTRSGERVMCGRVANVTAREKEHEMRSGKKISSKEIVWQTIAIHPQEWKK